MPDIWRFYERKGLSKKVIGIILESWRDGTKSQYKSYIERWHSFCLRRGSNPCNPSESCVLEFLLELHENNLSYSSINSARSALSSFIVDDKGVTVGKNSLVRRFMKGIFLRNPPSPRYCETWDVSVVLSHLKTLVPLERLSLKFLTL